jgi:hypothetical protein
VQWLQRAGALVLGAMPLMFSAGAAFGDEGISLHITNDGTADLFVTVTDANSHIPIIEHQRLNGFATLPITVTADEQGHANITWTTISVDNGDRHCGRGTSTGLETDASVTVRADSSC